jgi:hypothetical protein
MEKNSNFAWLKSHADTAVTLSVLFMAFFWMHGELMNIGTRIGNIEKDITMIKTVMILKNIMPSDMCNNDKIK